MPSDVGERGSLGGIAAGFSRVSGAGWIGSAVPLPWIGGRRGRRRLGDHRPKGKRGSVSGGETGRIQIVKRGASEVCVGRFRKSFLCSSF